MIRPELDALLQGALDNTLTAEERAQLARELADNPDARARAARLTELSSLLDSLGPAEAPPGLVGNVLAQVSHRPQALRPSSTIQRGVAVNKKILFGLAAAAAIVLAVITYNSNPPATVGTEATIGAAQRAQTPQIAAKDVKLGDTSTQDVLQTETFDAIMKDEAVRTALQDPEIRAQLQNAEVRSALQDEAIRTALADPQLIRRLQDPNLSRRALDDAEMKKLFDDTNLRALLRHRAFAEALRRHEFRSALLRGNVNAALRSDTMLRALRDQGFDAAMRSDRFSSQLASRADAKK
jgi:hypothetical protein